jgi:hypothetical protein
MKVLIACEFSGIVRRAFEAKGHDAWSCDLLPTEDAGPHYRGDVLKILNDGWDLMIGHPPCTHLSLAGARWFYDERFPDKKRDQKKAIKFFQALQNANIPRIAIENPQPLGCVMDEVGRYNQKFQPWNFRDNETKGICLWLKNLAPLIPLVTEKPKDIKVRVWRMPPGPDRQKERSRFFEGVATAMAEQWVTA